MDVTKFEIRAPDPQRDTGWTRIEVPTNFGEGQGFVSGEPCGNRLRVAYFLRESDRVLCAKAWFGWSAEGPPGHAHGGSVSAVLDESMGIAAWMAGHPVVAATLLIAFRSKLPLGTDATVEARVESVDGRKITTRARIFDPASKKLFAEGEGLFIKQPLESFGNLQKLSEQAARSNVEIRGM